jgi:hypothetical protein
MDGTEKKTASKKGQKPVKTIRRGAIAANIFLRQTQTGMEYHDYSLSRSWKSNNTGKSGYSTSYFPRNAQELIEVVAEASRWIEEQERTPDLDAEDVPAGVAIARIQPVKVPAAEAIEG